ncbi:hypothetical protein [Microcoleus sp.]|jgi:hypothetical protein|uniref:hypothetical protein n=1 Tax=Microcoleus sp. TaxID=44472 RepID=UPI00403E9430
MPSDKPRVTVYLEKQEMEVLTAWAGQEFLTVPQLTRVVVKRAIAEYLKQHPLEVVADVPETQPPPTTKPATTTKSKRSKTSKT